MQQHNINHNPALYNIFSNVWFYFGYNNQEHEHILKKIKATHGINKLVCLDDLCQFWDTSNKNNGETYNNEIQKQIIINKRTKLTTVYNHIKTQIDTALKCSNKDIAPTVLCLYTMKPNLFECLIGSYLYYLNKTANINLATSARTLASKIYGVNYQMTEEMKQYLFLICST